MVTSTPKTKGTQKTPPLQGHHRPLLPPRLLLGQPLRRPFHRRPWPRPPIRRNYPPRSLRQRLLRCHPHPASPPPGTDQPAVPEPPCPPPKTFCHGSLDTLETSICKGTAQIIRKKHRYYVPHNLLVAVSGPAGPMPPAGAVFGGGRGYFSCILRREVYIFRLSRRKGAVRGVAQPGRALGSGPRSRWFKSSRPDSDFIRFFCSCFSGDSFPKGFCCLVPGGFFSFPSLPCWNKKVEQTASAHPPVLAGRTLDPAPSSSHASLGEHARRGGLLSLLYPTRLVKVSRRNASFSGSEAAR